MVFELDYKALMRKLDKDLMFSVTIAKIDLDKFKKRLSQAKVRMAIEGKLSFEATDSQTIAEAIIVDITLIPKPKTGIKVYQVNSKRGGFEL